MNVEDRFLGVLAQAFPRTAAVEVREAAFLPCPSSFFAGFSQADLSFAQTFYAVAAQAAVKRVARETAIARAAVNN